VDWAVRTHRGRIREQNEDFVRVEKKRGLAVLCDGMGGHRAGEVASRMATEAFFENCSVHLVAGHEGKDGRMTPETARLVASARSANQAVLEGARRDDAFRGMGCTLVALLLDGSGASFVSVGDSRLYLLRGGKLTQVTEDHTRVRMLERMGIAVDVAEARNMHGLLVRALGTHANVEIDHGHGAARLGDVWLLCSDGLTDELGDPEIARILTESRDAEAAAAKLVARAVEAGGRDNVTVAVARVTAAPEPSGDADPPRPETSRVDDEEDSAGD
jgi:protein phosphatase